MSDRHLVHLHDVFVTVELPDDALDAIARFHDDHSDELQKCLAEFGIEWRDVITPKYERLVWDDELQRVPKPLISGKETDQ